MVDKEFCLSNKIITYKKRDVGLTVWDVKTFVEKLKEMIKAEQNVANKYDNSISDAVKVILHGFNLKIDKLAGEKLI